MVGYKGLSEALLCCDTILCETECFFISLKWTVVAKRCNLSSMVHFSSHYDFFVKPVWLGPKISISLAFPYDLAHHLDYPEFRKVGLSFIGRCWRNKLAI